MMLVADNEKKIFEYQNENMYSSTFLWDAIQSNRSVFAVILY